MPVWLVIELFASMVPAYLFLRFFMYILKKIRRKSNGSTQIASMGIVTWAIATVVSAYGRKDRAPDPDFLFAFVMYFGPVMAVTVIELVKYSRQIERQSQN